jgi:pyridoxal phosphate enzyme (YggS family)
MNHFLKSLENVNKKIDLAKTKSPYNQEVMLLPVSKTKSREIIQEFVNLGCLSFGENRVQECLEKYSKEDSSNLDLHFLGNLQSNKIAKIVPLIHWVHSVDRLKTLRLLDSAAKKENKNLNVLFEYNTSSEEQKQGIRKKEQLWELCKEAADFQNVSIRGLMTIAEFTNNETVLRNSFKLLKDLFEESKSKFPELVLDTLSMGMSNDYELAIEEGSTLVRIGTALFGARN